MKFKVGDKVRVADEIYGHAFDIGEVVEVSSVDESDRSYLALSDSGGYWVWEDEIEHCQNVSDSVDSPDHYGQGQIECIDYIKDFLTEEEYVGYLRGNINKYLHRWPHKNGLEDLKKADKYLEWLIEVVAGTE